MAKKKSAKKSMTRKTPARKRPAGPVSKERDKLDVFRTSKLAEKTNVKRQGETPEHPFFEACEDWLARAADLEAAYETEWLALERRFADYARGEIQARQARNGTRTFNDLLLDLATALDHHAPKAAGTEEFVRRVAKLGGEYAIKGGGRAAALDMAQDHMAALQGGPLLDLTGEIRCDTAQADGIG